LLLLGGWLRLLGYGRRLDNCRFLFFREPQPALRHVENDGAIPFKGDFARKVSALLGPASVLVRPGTCHGDRSYVRYKTQREEKKAVPAN
jgi:hypothetical protein